MLEHLRILSLRPTPEGAATLVLSGFIFILATNLMAGWLFFLLALLVALLVVGAYSAATAVQGVRVVPGAAPPAVEGGTVALPLTVEARRAVRFLRVGADVDGRRAEVFVPALRRGERRAVVVRLPAPRRGVHTIEGVRVISAGLIGMFRIERRLPAGVEAIVRPRYQTLTDVPVGFSENGGEVRTRRRRGTELFGIREYHPGDPARHIHWRSSARHQRLLVKEFEEPAAPVLALVADADRSTTPDTLDRVARAAATIAFAGLRRGYDVAVLWWNGDGPVVVRGSWEHVWTALARLQADGPPLPQALAHLRPHLPGEAVPVAISGPMRAARDGAITVGPEGSGAEWQFDHEGSVRWTGS